NRPHNLGKYKAGVDLPQEHLDGLLALGVSPLAEMRVPKVAVFIDEILGRPAAAREHFPYLVIGVDHNGLGQAELADPAFHVRLILREGELGRMHANDPQPFFGIAFVPGLHVRQSTYAVDACIVPEVHQDDAPSQLPKAQGWRIQPNTSDLGNTYRTRIDFHRPCSSMNTPTSAAQRSTNCLSADENAAL